MMEPELRPKLKQDSIFLPTREGVMLRNGSTIFSLKGASIYRWLASLAPHLTGDQTLAEICAPLEPERRQMVSRLVNTLLEKGIVKNHIPEQTNIIPLPVREQFKSQIEFIDHFADRPLQRFRDFRHSRILLKGAGEAFKSLAMALARNGLETLYLDRSPQFESELEELKEQISALELGEVKPKIYSLELSGSNLSFDGQAFDMVAYCSDSGSLSTVAGLNSLCYREGIKFISGIVFENESIVGPLVNSGETGCWMCAMLRYTSNLDAPRAARFWKRMALRDEPSGYGRINFITTARMLGNNLAFEIFKVIAGAIPPETKAGVLIQDLENLEASRPSFLPSPLCPVCSQHQEKPEAARLQEVIARDRDRELNNEEQLSQWYQFIEPRLGIFHGFEDDEELQLPLRLRSLKFGHPSETSSDLITITSHSIETTAAARQRALQEAIKLYSQMVISKGRMVRASMEILSRSDGRPVAPEALSCWSGGPSINPRELIEWMPAFALPDKSARYIPAAAVYSNSELNRLNMFEQTDAGTAVGATLDELLFKGLLSALAFERLRGVSKKADRIFSLDLEILQSLDTDLAYLIKTSHRLDARIKLWELTGSGSLRVVLSKVEGGKQPADGRTELAYGLSLVEAVKEVLTKSIGAVQSPDAAGSALRTEPLLLGLVFSETGLAPLERDRYDNRTQVVKSVEDLLGQSGQELFFVNTTPPDVWSTETFITGKVLLAG
jgi:bacteriocin biosynthesis cyclodehydratase domain-containing protein